MVLTKAADSVIINCTAYGNCLPYISKLEYNNDSERDKAVPAVQNTTVNTAVIRSKIAVLSCFGAMHSAVGSGYFNTQRISFHYNI